MEYEPKSGVFLHWHVDIHFYLCNRGVFYQVTDAMSILNPNLSSRTTLNVGVILVQIWCNTLQGDTHDIHDILRKRDENTR